MLKKTLWLLAAAACALALWRFTYPATLRYFFRVGGTITMDEALNASYLPVNSTLLVMAKNSGGVPVAVKKIINPVFPLSFEITSANLIMPDLLTRKIFLEAFLNNHGRVGVFRKGDLKGEAAGPVEVFRRDLAIRLYAP